MKPDMNQSIFELPPTSTDRFVFFGEVLGLILGTPQSRIESTPSGTISIAGAESNTAIALARLGYSCQFNTAVGHDPFGERILRTLRAERLDVSNVTPSRRAPTGLLVRNCFAWREPDVFYYRKDTAFLSESLAVAERVKFQPGDIFFTTGITLALGPQSREAGSELMRRAYAEKVPVYFDANFRSKLWTREAFRECLTPLLPSIHTLFVGIEEGRILTGATKVADIAKKCLQGGVQEILIKDGGKGAWQFRKGQAPLHGKAFKVAPIDTIGAGDAFNAGFLSARREKLSRPLTLRTANAMGAMACMGQGDWESMPTRSELGSFVLGETQARR